MKNQADENENLNLDQSEIETGDESGNAAGDSSEQSGQEEVVVTIGDAPPPEDDDKGSASAPEWVREVRKQNRELAKRNRELEAQIAAKSATPEQKQLTEVGQKPTLEGCEYDPEEFERQLDAWKERKRQADDARRKAELEQEAAQTEWQNRVAAYGEAKAKLRVDGFEDAEEAVLSALNQSQQALILSASDNPALMVAAIGKNKAELDRLSKITDPVKFVRELSRLEDTKLKVTPRRTAPPPESTVRQSGGISGGAIEATLERLRAEAEKTGDYSKVIEFKRQKRG